MSDQREENAPSAARGRSWRYLLRWGQRPEEKVLAEAPHIAGSLVHVDKRSYAIDRLFFQRLWRLCRPYWVRNGAWPSWVALGVLFALVIAFSLGGAQMAQLSADQTNALVAKEAAEYWHFWTLITLAGLVRFGASIVQTYVGGRLNLHWRQWLTLYLVDRYLEHRTYYEITVDSEIDNPDQRIQEHVDPFVKAVSGLPQQLLGAGFDIMVQIVILMAISRTMLIATFIYAVFQTVLTLYLYKPTIRQNWDSTVAEADLRYGLLHVRDHAETIAFYRGEAQERRHIEARTRLAVLRQLVILKYQQFMAVVQQFSNLVWGALPMVIIAPLYFTGEIEYGAIMTGIVASSLILQSLSTLMNYIPTLSQMAPMAVRLAEIQEKFDRLGEQRKSESGVPRLAFLEGDGICLKGVTLQTPGGEQTLVRDLSVAVAYGESLVIVGQTGSGKSSLLRAMGGLWTRGSGTVIMPPREQTLFLPQRPYMVLGTLRDQVLYPQPDALIDDFTLQGILERVGLPDLVARNGGLDTERDWARILSLGEQQRIGFARVLVIRPRFVLLDEATSALDLAMEQRLYELLRASGATYVSVAHRPSVVAFHQRVLNVGCDEQSNESCRAIEINPHMPRDEAREVENSDEKTH
ncbi:ATP-binding cassette domain-containing protein [Pseudomonas sp. 13B_2.1_Bac1]|uniref:ABC transporter ATP-binding protein/permease n=1 Tax=Pseudomonas sp. 13B_2.1_Bac1 TaxID=2971624 RepID=UPI0021C86E7F|nr:ATP-binding cassette domain-containing protein [Pseudomonas sp. 13B_2.1_Bac1]MCU1785290.1 ATP-binding cassette domain-containing protein [Pseudomonas sp. 13B_2.1_Bac1]